MILTCPACQTRYQADASKFPPQGRNVRCARCGEVWHQAAAEPDADAYAAAAAPAQTEYAPPAPSYPQEEPQPRTEYQPPSYPQEEPRTQFYAQPAYSRDEEPQDREEFPEPETPKQFAAAIPPRLMLAAGWAALAAVVLVIGIAAAAYRHQIVQVWPQSASLYSRLGMKVNATGLEIRDVKSTQASQDGQSVLTVSGSLTNVSNREQPVPQVRVALVDLEKRELYHWTFAPEVMTLRPGQSTHFVTRLSSPPEGVHDTVVRFAKAGE